MAPQYVAEELLRAEGFTDVRYVDSEPAPERRRDRERRGGFQFELCRAARPDDGCGDPITVLAGVHTGCFELFANESIHSITDLKGKTCRRPSLGLELRICS